MGSRPFSLSTDDLLSVGRGLLYVMLGAGVEYALAWAGTIDQTSTTGLAVVIAVSGVANLVKRWLTDSRK